MWAAAAARIRSCCCTRSCCPRSSSSSRWSRSAAGRAGLVGGGARTEPAPSVLPRWTHPPPPLLPPVRATLRTDRSGLPTPPSGNGTSFASQEFLGVRAYLFGSWLAPLEESWATPAACVEAGRGTGKNGSREMKGVTRECEGWRASEKSPCSTLSPRLKMGKLSPREANCLMSGHIIGKCGKGCSQEEDAGFEALRVAFALFQLTWPLIDEKEEDKK